MHRIAALILAFSLAAPSLASACGPSAVCGDVISSITGEFISDFVRIEWATDSESGVWRYVVRSYPCTDPATCSPGTIVASVTPAASCGTGHTYQVDDTGEAGALYSVEVWSGPTVRTCAIDVEPQ